MNTLINLTNMPKTQHIEKLAISMWDENPTIKKKINEIIDFIRPKKELEFSGSGTGGIKQVNTFTQPKEEVECLGKVAMMPINSAKSEPQIDQYTVDKILEVFYDGDWVSEASSGWTDENTNGYIIAKEEFTKFLKSFKNYL